MSDTLTMQFQSARVAARAGDLAEARQGFWQVIEVDPQHADAWFWLSHLLPTVEDSLRCLDQVLAIDPRHHGALEARSRLQLRLMVEESALVPALVPAPSTAQRRYLLGEALVDARVITTLQRDVALAEQRRLADADHPVRLGEILFDHGLVSRSQLEAALAAQVESAASRFHGLGTMRIGQFLVRQGLITLAQLHQGLAEQAQRAASGEQVLLGEMLVGLGYMRRDQLNCALLEWSQRNDDWLPLLD